MLATLITLHRLALIAFGLFMFWVGFIVAVWAVARDDVREQEFRAALRHRHGTMADIDVPVERSMRVWHGPYDQDNGPGRAGALYDLRGDLPTRYFAEGGVEITEDEWNRLYEGGA